MSEDHVASSTSEESPYDFVRRNVAKDRGGEAAARKRLADELAGRITKIDITLRPRSVIMTRKKLATIHEIIEDDESDAQHSGQKSERAKHPHAKLRAPSGKARTTSEEKLLAFAEIAGKHGESRHLKVSLLVQEVADKLNASFDAVNTFWKLNLKREQREYLLYGDRSANK